MAVPLIPNILKPDCQSEEGGEEEEFREVHFYASFALCVSVPENYIATMNDTPLRNPSHTYRLSYTLLPTEDKTDIDVALYGSTAKLYCKDQTICLKVYEEEAHVWIAWSKLHALKVSDYILMRLFNHRCNVFLGNVAEKIRFERPVGFCVTDRFYESVQFIRKYSQWTIDTPRQSPVSIYQQAMLPLKIREKLSLMSVKSVNLDDVPPWQEVDEIIHSPPSTTSLFATEHDSATSSEVSSESLPFEEIDLPKVSCGLQPVRNTNYQILHDWIIAKKTSVATSEYLQVMREIPVFKKPSYPRKSVVDFTTFRSTMASGLAKSRMPKVAATPPPPPPPFLYLKMKAFFSGVLSQAVKMQSSANISNLADAIFLVSVDEELLSPKQKIALNPLSVKLQHVEDLPELEHSPVNPSENKVYLKYKLLNKERRTRNERHNTAKVVLNDFSVFLLGNLSPVRVREFLCGPPLLIEVHDRDNNDTLRTLKTSRPSIYGSDASDSCSFTQIIPPYKMIFDDHLEFHDPLSMFGVAHVNLSDFLRGRTQLEFCEQVMCSLVQKRRQNEAQKYVKEQFNPEDIYLSAGTSLEGRISLSVPLFNPLKANCHQLSLLPHHYFARIVIKFSSTEKMFLYRLLLSISDINTSAFVKNQLPTIYCLGLSFPLLTLTDRAMHSVDIITGVHIFYKTSHVFYLEGLALGSMQLLSHRLSSFEDTSEIKILYNSAMIFSERLYLLLPAFLCHLRLYLSPKKLLCNAHRCKFDTTNDQTLCLRGLQSIQRLVYCKSLEEVTRHNLFPTKNMILSISQYFGHMMTTDQLTNLMMPPEVS